MKPLHILSTFILLSAWIPTYSKTVYYNYDDAGNRIKREITIPRSNMPKKATADSKKIEDELSDRKVNITVGSKGGTIKIEIPQYNSSDHIRLKVFDIAGHVIYKSEIISTHTVVDLTASPSGIYIMWIHINDDSMSYKLIKQ